ncbi:MAG TPA: antibiotic biosynthesis monooxygenase [Acidimicrobiia bacterium]|nr:antibiotic biosynthesis monooxygenase [Acidimicrobiia bacterium]
MTASAHPASGDGVIVRIWHGWASRDQLDGYPAHFRNRVVPVLRELDGFREATLLRREDGAFVEFTVLTAWTSMKAISAFAGQDPSKAVVEPEAVAALDHFDTHATHHQTMANETTNR